ncbi:MAG: NADP-specific glutamate dehydrogenase [Erysipelotrichia bacterium]|jgi:glutamate dehydrogenase (NADP+)|nr:NADP-specific glutamate dehydrogenase [Erysipelotrichia bacterium]
MYQSKYLNRVFSNVKKRYVNEPEFISAIEEFFDSMDFFVDSDPRIEKEAILERLVVPERVISFRVAWVDDQNKIQVNTGYRVQYNSAIGPYKGGIRFDSSVNLSILKFLAFEQTFKNSLTGLPMGGGKGGSDFNPRGRSDNEIMRFCQAYMTELYRHIGPNTDVPAGDFGVGFREIGYMYGMYKKLVNDFTGTFTGKGIPYGGSLGRKEATGYGLIYFVRETLKTFFSTTLDGKRIIISGSGKVGKHAAVKAHELGAKIVAMSDINGFVYDENGLDIKLVDELSEARGEYSLEYIKHYPQAKFVDDPKKMWAMPCDIALPCATQNEIYLEHAKSLKEGGCYLLIEGANMPSTVEAIRYFSENGILFAPGKAANAGGVAVSGLEMTQNATHLPWSYEEVDKKLEIIMKDIFKKCHDTANKFNQPRNLALGANIAGFLKVYEAMVAQGVI